MIRIRLDQQNLQVMLTRREVNELAAGRRIRFVAINGETIELDGKFAAVESDARWQGKLETELQRRGIVMLGIQPYRETRIEEEPCPRCGSPEYYRRNYSNDEGATFNETEGYRTCRKCLHCEDLDRQSSEAVG